jgi:hypothetical protein
MLLATLLLAAVAGSTSPVAAHFDVNSVFVPGKIAGAGEVAVTFTARDPDVHINEYPAPRLKLDAGQKVLTEKPRNPSGPAPKPPAPGEAAYLDLSLPVVFPVVVASAATPAIVRANVTYFYCSKRDGWCRKGTAELEIPVKGR